MPAAGWYQDPDGSGKLRWWDGAGWTDHLHEAAEAADPVPTVRSSQTVQQPAEAYGEESRFGKAGTRGLIPRALPKILILSAVIVLVILAVFLLTSGGDGSPDKGSGNVHVVQSSSQFSERKQNADIVAKQQLDSIAMMVKIVRQSNHDHYPGKAQLLKSLNELKTGISLVINKNPRRARGKLVILKSTPNEVVIATASTVGNQVFMMKITKGKSTITR